MSTPCLFSYGTLSDPEYTQLLLRRLPQYTPAELPGYALYTHAANGYLFAAPEKNGLVKGRLFQLSWRELQLIDLWEEVPLYERGLHRVKTGDDQWTEAFVYTRKKTQALPVSSAPTKSRMDVLNDIEDFLESMRRGGFFR